MAKDYHIIHKRGKTPGKTPTQEGIILQKGEIAVNYAAGNETLFINNSAGNDVGFPSENVVNSAVTSAVTNEATQRELADNALDTRITDEATVRQSGDTVLTVNYTNLNNRVELIEDILRQHGWL